MTNKERRRKRAQPIVVRETARKERSMDRWRIGFQGSNRFLYKQGSSIVASRFFSLFEIQDLPDGSHIIADNSGAELYFEGAMSSPTSSQLMAVDYTAEDAASKLPQKFWFMAREQNHFTLCLTKDCTSHLSLGPRSAATRLVAASSHAVHAESKRRHKWKFSSRAGESNATFWMERVIDGSGTVQQQTSGRKSFRDRVRDSTTTKGRRDFVLVTYHNIGMIDWATLFWGWLGASGIQRFMLLELDNLTCAAARVLNCSLHFECATAMDLQLPAKYTDIKRASSLQDWGTDANSAYFKFLRWKLRVVELILDQGVDVLMADVDVLVLSPEYYLSFARSKTDLTISSDARTGSYSDNQHCPCSHPMYQRYSVDWVCAGNFYMRSTPAALWFINAAVKLMDDYTITDQDAIQALLTGHTQVAVPMVPRGGNFSHAKDRLRQSSDWLKPLWLEGLGPLENLKNQRGIQPLNTPMKAALWARYQNRMRSKKFRWTTVPLNEFGNGPMLAHHWDTMFGTRLGAKEALGQRGGKFVSIHANCNTKSWLAGEAGEASFLHQPFAEGQGMRVS